jgi:DNA primase
MRRDFDILDTAKGLGIKILRKASSEEYIARCPLCGDSENPEHGHLYLNISKNVYYCVRCGEGGDVVDLYAKLTNLSKEEAYKELISGNIPVPRLNKENSSKVQNNPVAPIEIRDRVYRAFLDKLVLEPYHRRNLLKRGLSWEETAKNLYKSLPEEPQQRWEICRELIKEGYNLKGIPGFYQREKDGEKYWDFVNYKGFLIPVKDVQGRIQGFQIRLDEEESRKYVWFSSRGKPDGTPAHAWQGVHGNPAKEVFITEGPLKADVAHYLSGYTFISVAGVTAVKGIEVVLKDIGAQSVYIVFDMDLLMNKAVKNAKAKLEEKLKNTGFQVRTKTWDPAYKGIDDYLLHKHKEKQRKIV